MIKKLLFLLLFLVQFSSFSQNSLLSDNATVSVFTCGKGDELYTVFGHTAIRIKDINNSIDVVYNYGAFDFRTENFYGKFVKGDLHYFIVASTYDDFIYEYQQDKREVIEQYLNFSKDKKQQLFDKLNASLYSDERSYTYKFIDRNCTTMVTEKINETIGNELIKKVDDTSISYREVLYPYFKDHFWYKLGINIIFGTKTDKNAEKLFLPIELLHSLDKASINGKSIVYKKEVIVEGNDLKESFSFFNSIYFVSALLLLILVVNKKYLLLSYLFILGLLGLFFSLVGFYSFHKELLWNYNVLLFSPLYLFLPFIKNHKWFRNLSLLSGILLLVYLIFMLNKPHLVLVLPFIATTVFVLWKLNRTTKTS